MDGFGGIGATEMAIALLFGFAVFTLFTTIRTRKLSKIRGKAKKQASDFIIMVGLAISSVLDPAAKNRIEILDSERKRKLEAGKENE